MEKSKVKIPNAVIWTGAGIAVVAGIWFFFLRDKDKGALNSIKSVASSLGGGFRCISRDYPLTYGTCHPGVEKLQRYLNKMGASLDVDGKFGPKTRDAAIRYLKSEKFDQSFIDTLKV
ncbi:MAG: peptidoglycan-binding protein [Flavobacteriales bacterium]|nr:peptidoglycan-binding protein [Flavobacteriales bacterium]